MKLDIDISGLTFAVMGPAERREDGTFEAEVSTKRPGEKTHILRIRFPQDPRLSAGLISPKGLAVNTGTLVADGIVQPKGDAREG